MDFKRENEALHDCLDALEVKIKELQAENAELKAKAQILSDELDKYKSVVFKQLEEIERLKKPIEYDSRVNDLFAEIDCGERMVSKYKQTLQEIKEIAENYLIDCQGFRCDAMDEILQLIEKGEEE